MRGEEGESGTGENQGQGGPCHRNPQRGRHARPDDSAQEVHHPHAVWRWPEAVGRGCRANRGRSRA